jgi:Tol biopolymer transport system component/tRNA A-37 threonylcarbamoyl transferase component Bud32
LTIDQRLSTALSDRYKIERELGQGGMATVYLAEDLKHRRRVAIKVLRPELAAVIGAERFVREIQTIAALQHPHILGLIDSGELNGTAYYVMPFIEGESLRDRLNREKQLSISEAVRLATEVSSALDYAHRHGVIHRDIKPENILLHDGQALVADFGIALAVSSAGGSRMTETGMSLGTPHYMSPEQAMGERAITARSDIYALGCVTYEMLTGDPPFTGSTAQAIVAKMMTEKPIAPSRVRDTVPAAVEDAVLTALAKLPADRFASAAEFAAALRDLARITRASTATPVTASTPALRWSVRSILPWVLAAVAAAFGLASWSRIRPAAGEVTRFEIRPVAGTQFAFPINGVAMYLALSPDGRQVVYSASRGGSDWALYIRDLDQLDSRLLPGTDGAVAPEFSPDGKWIAFGAPDGSLKKLMVNGSSLTTLCQVDVSGIAGLTWTSNQEVVFTRVNLTGRGLWRVPADGGQPVEFSQFDSASGERLQLSPRSAADGKLVLYSSTRASTIDLKIGVVSTSTGKTKVFADMPGARALGFAEGFLLYVRIDGTLMASPFDPGTLKVGAPLQILDSIATRGWQSPAALSANGTLLYQRGGLRSQLVRVDQHGVVQVLLDSARVYAHPRLSPDGQRIAFESQAGSSNEIWIADLAGQTAQRLTKGGFNDRPEWTPDGGRVLYISGRTKANSVWWQPADGSGTEEMLFQGPDAIREAVFTPGEEDLVYRIDTPDSNRDIYRLPLGAQRQPVPLLNNIDDDKEPRVSPDGKWLAYVSNASGREEVYVRPLAGGPRVTISSEGGGEPLWSPDGRRLYYRAGARLIAVTVSTAPSLAVISRQTLFEGPYISDQWHPNYDVAPDGKSFIMLRPVEENRQLVMVVNWIKELRQRTGKAK